MIFGNPVERALWFCLVAGMITLAAYLGVMYFSKYTERGVRIERRFRDVETLDIPGITLCENLQEKMACYNNIYLFNRPLRRIGVCEERASFVVIDENSCLLNCDMNYNSTVPGCVILNTHNSQKQRLKNEYPIKVRLIIQTSSDLSVFVGDVTNDVIYHSQLSSKLLKMRGRGNIIQLKDKTRIERLPKPFLSNCSNGVGIENFFSDIYSQRSCIQSCFMREMFDKCGTVIDRWNKFLTLDMKRRISAAQNVTSCLSHHLDQFFKYIIPDRCECPLACSEVVLESDILEKINGDPSIIGMELSAKFLSMEEMSVEEIPEYTFYDFLAEMGGLVGVLVGMSIISVLEVLVYFVLHITKLFLR